MIARIHPGTESTSLSSTHPWQIISNRDRMWLCARAAWRRPYTAWPSVKGGRAFVHRVSKRIVLYRNVADRVSARSWPHGEWPVDGHALRVGWSESSVEHPRSTHTGD